MKDPAPLSACIWYPDSPIHIPGAPEPPKVGSKFVSFEYNKEAMKLSYENFRVMQKTVTDSFIENRHRPKTAKSKTFDGS